LNQLLQDVLVEPGEESFEAAILPRFRRQVRERKLLRGARVGAAGTLLLVFVFFISVREPNHRLASSPTILRSSAPDSQTQKKTLTDEELLACFPPGSCFLAEVGGKTVLVFTDPSVKEHYLN
jgi:hypothetical protein